MQKKRKYNENGINNIIINNKLTYKIKRWINRINRLVKIWEKKINQIKWRYVITSKTI